MTKNEWEQDLEHQELEKKAYHRGYRAGAKAEGEASKRVELLENVLLEFAGHEDEWLQTKSGLLKRERADLVDQIIFQRQLMRELYNHLDDDVRLKLRKKAESHIWPATHSED
ncbi:hypothetical protein [Bacillus haynesii]|uniref:hypothetical protein n=1 Tax=Bacillus haynesii TaxID=1925021 RepID=UPI00227F4383|nr:hypothetical protein [Bacillus haynesii]MCY9156280.1 hypothetical protein [Bacillus haynesii]MCY9450365.1 hypothetical protein [Bacillus haynesii]